MDTKAGQVKPRLRRVFAGVTAIIATLAMVPVAVGSPSHYDDKAAVVGFNPGMIISDDVFYNAGTMDANSIQNFLNSLGAACVPGPDGFPCLKDYKQTTFDRPADAYCTGDYKAPKDGSEETAAQIIAKVAQACQINPQVLLVTLQKEQGLVTASGRGLTDYAYKRAMGYGCPDTAPCDAQYFGFFNQVYQAAHRFHYYQLHPEKFRHQAGRVNNLLYNPKRDEESGEYKCGSVPVFIENQATAGLYNYTPYTPNEAALAAGGGLGDECSSYGNRNFYRFFTMWFGSTGFTESIIASHRVSGNDRVETAVGISLRAFPTGSETVYIANANALVDALVGGTLTDGPVLLVPGSGVPQVVANEIARLNPQKVVALGGERVIPEQLLQEAAGERAVGRLFGTTRIETAISVAHHVFDGSSHPKAVYVADAIGSNGQGSPDAVAAGMLTDGPVLLVDSKNPESVKQVNQEVSKFRPERVVALGGPNVIPDDVLKAVSGQRDYARYGGVDRYATAAQIAANAYPTEDKRSESGVPELWDKVVYIARSDNFADAVASGSLTDGPILLVPSCTDDLPQSVSGFLGATHPRAVITLGGMGAVCPNTSDAAVLAVKMGMKATSPSPKPSPSASN